MYRCMIAYAISVLQVLERNKSLVVPTPHLKKGLLSRVSCVPDSTEEVLRSLASRRGIDRESKTIPMVSRITVDLVVVGSIAVDR